MQYRCDVACFEDILLPFQEADYMMDKMQIIILFRHNVSKPELHVNVY